MGPLKFSVSMCVYGGDHPEHFRTAVESVLCQTAKPDEVVLVVDGPVPDELKSIILEYERDPVFQVIYLPENQGHGNARRKGLSHCKNDLVALMDADDISLPQRFAMQLACFSRNPELSIVGGQIEEFIDTTDHIVGKRVVPTRDEELKAYLKKRCPFNQVTVMFRKEAVDSVGGYIDWYCEEDYYLWLRMAMADMQFANLPETLVHVRVGSDMYCRRGGWKYFSSEARLQKFMYRKKLISLPLYLSNVMKRFVVQVLLPSRIRGWVFQRLARE